MKKTEKTATENNAADQNKTPDYMSNLEGVTPDLLEQLGEVQSYNRIVKFENGLVMDGRLDIATTIKAFVEAGKKYERFKSILKVSAKLVEVPDGIISEMLMQVVSELMDESGHCNCPECKAERMLKKKMFN